MGERLDILFVTGEYPPAIGGVGDYTQQLGRALCARGHQVSVLTTSAASAEPSADEPRVLTLDAGWGWRGGWLAARTAVRRAPAVIHIQYQTGAYGMHPAINLLPWRIRRRHPRPRIVVTAHDLRLPYLLPKADRLRTWITTRLFADADALIVTNATDAHALQPGAPSSRELYSPACALPTPITTIPIGSNIAPDPPSAYDRAAWRQRLGVRDNDVLVAYFGLLSRTKGVLPLLAALPQLPQNEARRYRLLIIGGAAPQPDDQRYAAEVTDWIRAHDLGQLVQITGPCAPSDVSAHLLAADLVALPFTDGASYRRGSLLAALAHGCPTITTAPATPLDPPLLNGVHALLLPAAEPPLLRAAIERVAADRVLQATLSTGARALSASFAWSTIAAQHEKVYHSVQKAVAKKAHA